jgi:hypothetical protein
MIFAALLGFSLVGAAPVQIVEPVLGAQFGTEDLVVRVRSNGCTDKSSFDVRTQARGGHVLVTLARVRPDRCRGLFRDGTELRWGWDELGVTAPADARLVNPRVETPAPAAARLP